MLRPLGLCLLIACAVSLTSSAVITENGMPIKWQNTVDLLTDLPIQEGILTPDPWDYLQRMALYKFIIAATNGNMGSMGTDATDSPLWGLPLQLGWQLNSSRLADPTGATTCGLESEPMCISTQSWWGCVNYFISVLPFLSAAQQGLFGEGVQVQMQVPAGVDDYCVTYADCAAKYPVPMANWDAFYQGLKVISESTQSDLEKKDSILGLFWAAQQTSMRASSVCNTRQSHYSAPEVSFANAWLNSAEYVAATHFQSSIRNSLPFMTPLPSRVLLDTDTGYIADLSPEENHSLKTFSSMNAMNNLLGGTLVSSWQGTMCSVSNREEGRKLLEQLVVTPTFQFSSLLSFMTSVTGCPQSQ